MIDVYGADTDADDEYDYYSDLRDICDVDTDGDLYWSVWGKFILGVALAYHHHCIVSGVAIITIVSVSATDFFGGNMFCGATSSSSSS